MKPDYNKKLQAERYKLNRLVDEALKTGVPISQKQEITRQCKKVNEMIMEMKRGEEINSRCETETPHYGFSC